MPLVHWLSGRASRTSTNTRTPFGSSRACEHGMFMYTYYCNGLNQEVFNGLGFRDLAPRNRPETGAEIAARESWLRLLTDTSERSNKIISHRNVRGVNDDKARKRVIAIFTPQKPPVMATTDQSRTSLEMIVPASIPKKVLRLRLDRGVMAARATHAPLFITCGAVFQDGVMTARATRPCLLLKALFFTTFRFVS